MSLDEFQKIINYQFKDISLLENALTHSSYANEKQLTSKSCNERLEFLGDSVLGVITADYFYHNHNQLPEGIMTKKRAACACEKSLFGFAKEIELGRFMLLGRGEERTGGRNRASILADAFEAVIGAIYLDGGLDSAKNFVVKFIKKAAEQELAFRDYKTELQEIIQNNPNEQLNYVLVGESGPDHDKRFEIEVRLNSNVMGCGIGRSKKLAEQEAAKQALALMGIKN